MLIFDNQKPQKFIVYSWNYNKNMVGQSGEKITFVSSE